ncbi:P-loop containing nucleoside triphosphate hydrolase [Arabidopsis thaliana x Arabidopsis arenosa]|uniref:P-loop containing nucleoside triphosphate hydrolase n=1 Tax=Arabidopsis thaliana x Arabidopsis arenosa TaxID=1240361 RepID=A0A8T2B070_9BRAS|nr:P-loop containing nucleoside triphosphate hydrolase [Arabidopsis thaliana x Arabidopsis arenosa]
MDSEAQESPLLQWKPDDYGGVKVNLTEPMTTEDFVPKLRASLMEWRNQGKKGIWLKLADGLENIIAPAKAEGFKYHHAESDYLMLVSWLSDLHNTIPANASHRIGIAAFVLNSNREVLVVQEIGGPFDGTGVWKLPTGVIKEGEGVWAGAEREVEEETGIKTTFKEVLAFRESHKSFSEKRKTDIMFLCELIMKPGTFEIKKEKAEIYAAKWMPIEEYVNQPWNQEKELFRRLVMVEAFVSFGLQKLWELLGRESERLQGVDEQVDELKRQLGALESLLEDADAKKYESKTVRNFLEDVKDIVYDTEDIIETFLLKEERGNERGIRKSVKRLACFLVERQKIASDIEGLTLRISEVIERMQSFGIQQIIHGGHSLSLQERQREQREIRKTFPNNSESNLVAVEQSVEELVGHLVDNNNNNIQVVSVTGMGGIGKTTLARQVFHHDMVRRHFDGLAWLCISQEFTQKHVWQRILKDLRPHDGDISHMDEHTLQSILFKLLETNRYLIVLDDVWKEEDWDRVKAVFPRTKGWKILLTSRNESVGLHADPTCVTFRPRILTPEQSWELCQSIVFPSGDETEFRIDEERKAMCKKMVTHCGGLPLAVKVLGGLLATKHTVPEWKRVYENFGTQIVGGSGFDDINLCSVYQVLSLSYEDLPMHLKHCFLYLAHFPEDHKILLEKLYNYWAAEGMIRLYNNESAIRDSAEGLLEELVRRNMVISERRYVTSRIEHCKMHDMMRELCLSKAKEENFLQIVKLPISTSTMNAQSPSRSRRLSVHSRNALHILKHGKTKKIRSLFFFGGEEDSRIQSVPGLGSLPLLRVLDLTGVKFEGAKLPSSIGELIHLRLLNLYEAWVCHLPSSLRNLKRLLYLNLYVNYPGPVHVPNVLKEMLELRYLFLPLPMDDTTKLELGDLVNLDTLRFFSTKHCSVTDLLPLTKLRSLHVYFTGSCTSETISSSLREMTYLETFSLLDWKEIRLADHGGEVVLDFIHLKNLMLTCSVPRLSNQYRFPPNLAHISLAHCNMKEDPMPVLEKLLHLKSVVFKSGAFVGRRMVCSKGGFPQLCELVLAKQMELEEWRVEEGSMPCLHTLTINDCKKLKLPYEFKYTTSLKELIIEGMKREWKEKLVAGGEDYYKVQHIPCVQFIKCEDK